MKLLALLLLTLLSVDPGVDVNQPVSNLELRLYSCGEPETQTFHLRIVNTDRITLVDKVLIRSSDVLTIHVLIPGGIYRVYIDSVGGVSCNASEVFVHQGDQVLVLFGSPTVTMMDGPWNVVYGHIPPDVQRAEILEQGLAAGGAS